MTHVTSDNQWLKATVADLTKQAAMQSEGVSDVTNETPALPGKPDIYTQFTSFACTSDVVALSCPNSRTIFVTSAFYGQYYHQCDDECCPPNPRYDCSVNIEDDTPGDWLIIEALCDGQTSCEIENLGSVISECQAGYTSDYAQVFYDCLPVDEVGPVGFTAWANTGVETAYDNDEIMVFDQVISNFGGHYNPATSSFVCPFVGAYMVSVNVQAPTDSRLAVVNIVHNDYVYAQVFADNLSGLSTQASNTIIIECQRGDVLWVQSASSNTVLYAREGRSSFSAFLIHRVYS